MPHRNQRTFGYGIRLSHHNNLVTSMPLRDFALKPSSLSIWLVMLVAASASVGLAQDTFTLERCLALAKENSPRLRIAANAVRAAKLSLSEVGTTRLPQVTGVGGATYTPVPPTIGYDPAVTDGGQVAAQIAVRQPIYDAGIRGLKLDQLQLDMERNIRESDLALLELVFAVKQAYVDVVRAQEEVDLRRESLDRLTLYGDFVRRLYKGGTANYADVLKSEIQTSTASLTLQKAHESSALTRLSLTELIGVAVDSTASFDTLPVDASGSSFDTTDFARNLEMNIARLQMEKGQIEIQQASHERLPVLSLVADAGYLSSGENLRLPRADRLRTWGYSIGLGLEIPIFNWGATGLRVEQRELAADDLRLQMDLLRRSLTSEIRKAALQLSQLRTRLTTLRETMRKAEENYLLTKSRYAAGGTLAIEVFAAQQLLTDSKMDELQTRADIANLIARLERLTAHEQTPTLQ
jgi:outer membrane protein TolC